MVIISKWLTENRLVINTDKTKYNVFHFSRKILISTVFNITLASRILVRVDIFEYLGALFDNH